MLADLGTVVMIDSPDCAYDQVSKGLNIISTIDFFYPLVNDPFNQGRIGAANVISDLYSVGIQEIRNILMIIAASSQMNKQEQYITTKLMMQGFAETIALAESKVTGGQSVINEFPMIGGAAIGLSREETPYVPRNAKPGDVLVLTKPLGSQILVNVNQYYMNKDSKWKTLSEEKGLIKPNQIEELYDQGVEWMSRINRNASLLMREYGATSSTDITGFGVLGHSQNLADIQFKEVDYVIETLPTYPILHSLDKIVRDFRFKQGLAAETSGGLMISLPSDNVDSFILEMKQFGEDAWVIGRIEKGTRKARLSSQLRIEEVI